MRRNVTLDEARSLVRGRAALRAEGWRDRTIAEGVATGRLLRLQRNRYVRQDHLADLWEESRHLIRVVAAHAEMRDGRAAFSHESAAVLHGLPLYRHAPATIHSTLLDGEHAPSRTGFFRHRDALSSEDIIEVGGIRCTSLERTAFDVMRSVGRETALVLADAALRRAALHDDRYDPEAAERWRDAMRARLFSVPGARGVRQAAEIIELMDGQAESPGESVARLHFRDLGFRHIRLQVPVMGPRRTVYRVDLEVEEIATFVEFDGESKYTDEALRAGLNLQELLLNEKRREDWIRGVTQKRLVRIDTSHIATAATLAARLRDFGIHPPS